MDNNTHRKTRKKALMMIDIGIDDVAKGTPVATHVIEACAEDAARARDMDPDLLLAIILAGERGNNGMINWNTNDSFDLGVAQVNTIQWEEPWFASIYPDWKPVANDVCTNIAAAADIFHRRISELKQGQSIWNAVGHYHSKTKTLKVSYLQRVMKGYRIRAEKRGAGFNVY